MALEPRTSIIGGVAVVTMVVAIYGRLPTDADIRTAGAMDPDIDASRRAATWTAAGLVSVVALLAKDPTIFVLGGASVVAMDLWTRTADMHAPSTAGVKLRDKLLPVDAVTPAAPAGYSGDIMDNAYVW